MTLVNSIRATELGLEVAPQPAKNSTLHGGDSTTIGTKISCSFPHRNSEEELLEEEGVNAGQAKTNKMAT